MTMTMDMINIMPLKNQKMMRSPITEATKKLNKNEMDPTQQLYKDDKIVADLLLDVASVNKSFTISYNRLSVILQ